MSHSIVLYQLSKKAATRSWDEYASKAEAMDGVCRMYELQLKRLNPTRTKISYELKDLLQYVDELGDLSVLMYDGKTGSYAPYGREWVKKALVNRLKQMSK